MSDQPFPPPGFIPTKSAVEGIEVFMPEPEPEEKREEITNFKCPRCAASTAYSPTEGGIKCNNCGYYEPPKEETVGRKAEQFEFKVETVAASAHGWGEAKKEIKCGNCHATTVLPSNELSQTCPFCGSNKVVQSEASQDALRPRFIIPFKIEQEKCIPIATEWLGSSWMTPSKLKDIARLGHFTGIYLPFWTFDATVRSQWRAQVGYVKTETYWDDGKMKTRTVTDWRWENGNVKRVFDDWIITGTSRVSQGVLNAIKRFNLNELAPYEASYLAGWSAHAYETRLEDAWELGRNEMREQMRDDCDKDARSGGGDKVRNMNMQAAFDDESWRYVLMPVYLATYNYNDETYQIVINGQSGTIGGERPVEWTLVIGLILASFLPSILAFFVGLLIPFVLCIAGGLFFLAVAISFWLYTEANKIANPDHKQGEIMKGVKLW